MRELLAAGRRRVHEVRISESSRPSPLLAEIADLAGQRRVRVRHVSPAALAATAHTDAPQGVMARADPLPEAELDDLTGRPPDGVPPFLLVLDGVSDPHNLGALLRTAECAGATGAVLPRHRGAQVTATVTKVVAGAVEHVPMTAVAGVPAALAELTKAGVWTVGLDPGADVSLFDLPVGDLPIALVLGSEGRGLSRLARQRCDLAVAIPQRGSLESLNVSAAGAVACYEIARRRLGR